MSKVILVPNACIKTLDESSEYVLLRDWQKRFNKSNKLIVCEHPWANQNKLKKDFNYLIDLYNILITNLTLQLNEIHGLKFTESSWRVIIGPWLYNFIGVVFERWINIEYAFEKFDIDTIFVTNTEFEKKISSNYNTFTELALSHKWNEELFISIISNFGKIGIERNDLLFFTKEVNLHKGLAQKSILISLVKRFYFYLIKFFFKNKGILFFSSNFKNLDIIKFSFLNKSIPIIPVIYEGNYDNTVSINKFQRDIKLKCITNNKFEEFLVENVFYHIPTDFLEDFNRKRKIALNFFGPINNLGGIVTAAGYYHSLFSLYLAEAINAKIKIIGLQHGGGYGSALNSYNEQHEIKITKKFLGWGWNKDQSNVLPFYTIKPKIANTFSKRNYCSLFLNGNDLYSLRVSPESYIHNINPIIDYENIISLYSYFNQEIKNNFLFRPYPFDYGWNERAYFENRIDSFKWDSESTVSEIFNKSKILIFTLNSTGYLEAFSGNFPTILILTRERGIRDEALPYFNLLKANKILFENFNDAAIHINEIWSSVDEWWNSNDVQNAVATFNNQFMKRTENIAMELNQIFNDLNKI